MGLQARIDELPLDRQILAICRSGARSAAVVAAPNGAGFDAANAGFWDELCGSTLG